VANGFSREEVVLFDKMLEGFQDALIASRMATTVNLDQTQMERTGDIMWFPQPYIAATYAGNDATSNFKDVAQLSVPGTINNQRHAPWILTARELRDAAQEGRIKDSAYQRLASDINVDVTQTASLLGSIVVKRTVAATGFDDVALADASFTEQGIPRDSRWLGLPPRTYNGMASNLASRTLDNSKSLKAYERAMIGDVSGFDTYKLDYGYRLAAATATGVTITNTNPLFYTPVAYTTTAGRGSLNVDNRFQTISINVTTSTVKVGDCFTIAGVNAVHHIAKTDTGQLKTFRVVSIVTGAGGTGTIQITPPIISATGGTGPELQYQNVTAAPTNGAQITFLNTVAAEVSPFWHGDAVQILPGRLAPRAESGMAVIQGTTDNGFQLTMTRQGEINTLTTKYRVDAIWGSFYANPEMGGIEIFNQT
jgi:hypothetical protein